MTKDDIQLLYEYDRWANHRVLQAASSRNSEEFTRDLGGSCRSVRDPLTHIVHSELGWLTCWREPSPSSAFVMHFWAQHHALFNANAFADLAAVQRKWAEVEGEQVEFVNRVTNEGWERRLTVGTTQISLAQLRQLFANHSTYHRGQVALMMRQLAAEPLSTDFAMFLMEGRGERAGLDLCPRDPQGHPILLSISRSMPLWPFRHSPAGSRSVGKAMLWLHPASANRRMP